MMAMKTALVTGASRGIGRAIARHLSEKGFQIALHYHANRQAAEDAVATLSGSGHRLFSANLTQTDGAAQLAAEVLDSSGGRVDVLIHNAGVYRPTPVLGSLSLSEWQAGMREQMNLNFLSGADLSYLLAKPMADNGWGRIIHVASRSGRRGEAKFSGYGASKAAQINFVKSLAIELAPSGIGCFAITPGWVETDMSAEALQEQGDAIRSTIPMGRVATPEDIAQLIGYLVTPAADYLTGNTIDVNGASYLS